MKKLITLCGLSLLTGCSTYSETFDCGAGPGVGCKSLTYVNGMVERGKLPLDEDGLDDLNNVGSMEIIPVNGKRIWVAGHKDNQGRYHDESYIRLEG